MIHIDRNNIPIPEVFQSNELIIARRRLKEFYERPAKSRGQERYSKPFEPELRNQILVSLRKLFNGKCAYCESPISEATNNNVYDHFRPKSGSRGIKKEFSNEHYWWLTYEWNNLYYSCQNCNRYKATWFPVENNRAKVLTPYSKIIHIEQPLLIDPCNDRPEEHLVFLEDGKVDYITNRGKATIEILKLNRLELTMQRLGIIGGVNYSCDNMFKLWNNKRRNLSQIKAIAKEWEDLYLNSSTELFIGAQRQILSKWLNERNELKQYLIRKDYEIEAESETVLKNNNRINEFKEEVIRFDKNTINESTREFIEETVNFDHIRHVYIEKIVLNNFKCFAELTVNFGNEGFVNKLNEETLSEPWQLFLGENGVGKSSILKAITIALCGENYFQKLELIPSNLLQRGKKAGYIKLFLKGEEDPIEVKFDDKIITTTIKEPKANLIGYGSVRLLPKKGKLSSERFRQGGIKAQNLFDYSVSLTNADKWLLERNEKDFDRAAITLKDLMLLDNKVLIKRDIKKSKIFIQTGKAKLDINELSDGYQSVYALAVDIMASFVRDKISYDIAEGIVLIDEIGTHLHPRWKMEVVAQLRRTFPRIQFIVTTHEPLCLRGMKQGEVAVLTRDWDNNVYAISDLPDPATLRVDQLLTSPFFGLQSAIDPDTERLFNEYYILLAKEELNSQEENRKSELSDLIPKIKFLGDTLREELAIYVIDELLAKKKQSFNLDDLKTTAKERVKQIWDTLNTEDK